MLNKTVTNINLVKDNLEQVLVDNNIILSYEDWKYLFPFTKNKQEVKTRIMEDEIVYYSWNNIRFLEELEELFTRPKQSSLIKRM